MDSFLLIETGDYDIGIDTKSISNITDSFALSGIKPQYIHASAPAHKVHIESFFISTRLVTYNEFKIFIRQTSYITESEKEGWGWTWENKWKKVKSVSWNNPFMSEVDGLYREGDYPVMQVSWNDAVSYATWKSEIENKKYRLPYEAEWEVFAKKIGLESMENSSNAGKPIIYNSEDFLKGLASLNKYQVGFLWEWTLDWYKEYSGGLENRDFGNVYKVLRGGSLLSEDIQRTSDFRFRRCPTARSPYYGIRLVREI